MVLDGTLPARVNHLRIGEFALLGGIYGCYPDFLRRDVFTLRMEVVECKPKPSYPVGELTVDAFGKTREYTDRRHPPPRALRRGPRRLRRSLRPHAATRGRGGPRRVLGPHHS